MLEVFLKHLNGQQNLQGANVQCPQLKRLYQKRFVLHNYRKYPIEDHDSKSMDSSHLFYS